MNSALSPAGPLAVRAAEAAKLLGVSLRHFLRDGRERACSPRTAPGAGSRVERWRASGVARCRLPKPRRLGVDAARLGSGGRQKMKMGYLTESQDTDKMDADETDQPKT